MMYFVQFCETPDNYMDDRWLSHSWCNLFDSTEEATAKAKKLGVSVSRCIPLSVPSVLLFGDGENERKVRLSFEDRRGYLRELAIEIQAENCGGLSYGEEALLQEFFTKQGKRYGLLREFRENAII